MAPENTSSHIIRLCERVASASISAHMGEHSRQVFNFVLDADAHFSSQRRRRRLPAICK